MAPATSHTGQQPAPHGIIPGSTHLQPSGRQTWPWPLDEKQHSPWQHSSSHSCSQLPQWSGSLWASTHTSGVGTQMSPLQSKTVHESNPAQQPFFVLAGCPSLVQGCRSWLATVACGLLNAATRPPAKTPSTRRRSAPERRAFVSPSNCRASMEGLRSRCSRAMSPSPGRSRTHSIAVVLRRRPPDEPDLAFRTGPDNASVLSSLMARGGFVENAPGPWRNPQCR
jgi:hypothetical protein